MISREHGSDSNRIPRSSHVERKQQSNKATADIAYQMRSRAVNRSGPGKERDDTRAGVGGLGEHNDEIGTTVKHSYNLRSRVGDISADEQDR